MLKALLLAGAVVAIGIQLVPYGHDHANPPVGQEAPWPSPDARRLAVAACYDCHSNRTTWPWYSDVAPMSWLVVKDVKDGRAALNFTDWARSRHKDKLHDPVESGSMPPRKFTLMHPDARLSGAERDRLVEALRHMEEGGGGSGQGRNRGRGGGSG
ncbi:MAG TPA: heme-binding domain-containing protein [Acidimicrobiales bacterium]|nr:heme-binding domain-containing protein [Acidimicrobiales bacterium]